MRRSSRHARRCVPGLRHFKIRVLSFVANRFGIERSIKRIPFIAFGLTWLVFCGFCSGVKKYAVYLSMFVVVMVSLTGCATVKTTVSSPLPKGAQVSVISDRPLDDWKIHNAIVRQLQTRGYTAIDGGDSKSNPPFPALRYFDEWRWDLVMYLYALRVRVLDGKTGKIYSTADYQEGFLHGYPNSERAVGHIFDKLSADGAFAK